MCGKLEKSKRLQTLHLELTRAGRDGMTTRDIAIHCRSAAPHSDVADLRRCGVNVAPAKLMAVTDEGRKIYRYWID